MIRIVVMRPDHDVEGAAGWDLVFVRAMCHFQHMDAQATLLQDIPVMRALACHAQE